jgi:hypothetical protein
MLAMCAYALGAQALAQTTTGATTTTKPNTGVTANRVIGEVTGIDATAKQVTVKTDAGAAIIVALDDKSTYLRTQPGATNLDGATTIALADIRIGDRVYARGTLSANQKAITTRQLIVMTKADITAKNDREREEWRRRGVVGTVSAINPDTKEITLQVRSLFNTQPITIAAQASNVKYRRYAPDSVKFSDAKPSSFGEIKVGDQLRAKGERSADGTHFTPEEIVTGSFRSIRGTVVSTDPQAGEIKVKDMTSGQTLTVVISKDSVIRDASQFAQRMAMRAQGNGDAQGNAQGNGQGNAQGNATGGGQQRGQGQGDNAGFRRRPDGAGGDAAGGGQRRFGGGAPDMQDMLERMPTVAITDLKPGQFVIVSSTVGADPTRATAIALVTGLDALLQNAAAQRGGARGGQGGASLGLPSGALDIGIGLP